MSQLSLVVRQASAIAAGLLVLSCANSWAQSQDQSASSVARENQVLESAPSAKDVGHMQPVVVKSREELERLLASGPTVLDNLTPYGKRELLQSLSWGRRGLGGFSPAAPLRELNREQALAIYELLGVRQYFPKIFSTAPTIRLDDVSPQCAQLVEQFKAVIRENELEKSRGENTSSNSSWVPSTQFYRVRVKPLMHAQKLSRMSNSDVYLLFDMANEASFTLNSPSAVQDMKSIYRVFEQRGIDTRRGVDNTMLQALIRHRDLKAAQQFITEHREFADRKLPVLLDRIGHVRHRPTVLVDQGDAWVRTLAPFNRDKAQLVIVLSESCGFCRKFMSDLEADEALRQHLERAETMMLSAPGDGDPFEFVKRWNSTHENLRMYVPNKISEWKGFDSGRVPQFLIVRNGKILHSSFGWQKDGSSKVELLDQLAKFGL